MQPYITAVTRHGGQSNQCERTYDGCQTCAAVWTLAALETAHGNLWMSSSWQADQHRTRVDLVEAVHSAVQSVEAVRSIYPCSRSCQPRVGGSTRNLSTSCAKEQCITCNGLCWSITYSRSKRQRGTKLHKQLHALQHALYWSAVRQAACNTPQPPPNMLAKQAASSLLLPPMLLLLLCLLPLLLLRNASTSS
jgi:hypothetical protein